MAMNPLPPQAYTKDTLLRAYAWLQNQNLSIRGMATTPDILVSLYLKTTRDGEEALDRPSIQNFKNELKSLAGLMGELEIGQSRPSELSSKVKSPSSEELATQAYLAASASTSIADFNSNFIPPVNAGAAPQQSPPLNKSSAVRNIASATTIGLDVLSVQMLDEIKNGFNLSDQSEALRMLVKLGYEKAKKILIE